ncbi:MAG: FKBP-type peptidyl-prolyl cis-trans isomerase [Dysgonamonadaceae bacterium]|jgi:peptidylprolyl isomerase/FKBP-type peptidyl-prolyl cis-trans isomerase FklB|nr:FKBP-type peptidyl-prolyl cis-trans isomerase [Dysgonamonadaceae bacterium]
MKSKLFYFLLIPLFAFAFQSCKDKDDNSSAYAEWRAKNEAHIEAIRNNPEYEAVTIPQGPGTIYRKVLQGSESKDFPLFTDKVKARYKGSFFDGTVFEDATGRITEFSVGGGIIQGFTIAFQNMQVGEKWEIQIPWNLGYGSQGKGSIPPYSALVFELELVEIIQQK